MEDNKKKTKDIEKELKKPIYKVIGGEYVDRIYTVITENKYLTYMTIVLFIVIFFFLITISKLEEKIKIQVEIPPKIYQTGKIYIGYKKANGLFYKLWGEYVAREIGNYSPVNIDDKVQKVLYLFAPNKIVKAEADFLNFSKNIKDNLITNDFTPYKTNANQNGVVNVEGLSHKTIGANLLNETYLCTYKMKFITNDYHLFLSKFITDCKQISKKAEKDYLKQIKQEKRAEKIKQEKRQKK